MCFHRMIDLEPTIESVFALNNQRHLFRFFHFHLYALGLDHFGFSSDSENEMKVGTR